MTDIIKNSDKLTPELTEKQRLDFATSLQYMKTAKLILRDLEQQNQLNAFFKKYKKEDVIKWLETPEKFEHRLIEVSRFFYSNSQHFRRLIQYFGKMSKLAYIAIPYKLNEDDFDKEKFLKQYKTIIDKLDVMSIKNEFSKVINTMFREDVVYCYEYSTSDSYFIKTLPYNYCAIDSIIDGVYGFAFDFSMFEKYPNKLKIYGDEFLEKFELYKTDKKKYRWQSLNEERSFALKLSDDLDYVIPMFVNLVPLLYDIEDIKKLDKSQKEMDNYKLLLMKLELDDDGNFVGDYTEAEKYYNMLNSVLPSNIGLGMSPYDIKDYTFERSGTASETTAYSQAITSFWSSAGVSELLFNGIKSSSATIVNSIKCDTELIYSVHRMIERVINRKLKQESGKYKFRVSILDVTQFNEKEYLDALLSANNFGVPIKLSICACLGYTPADTYGMTMLEDVLDIVNKWKPLQSSSTLSSKDGAGAPTKDDGDLSDSGAATRDNDNRKLK